VQRGGAVRDRKRVAGIDECAESALELLDAGAHAPPAGIHSFFHGRAQLFVNEDV
jgi:hypothetical protein